MTARTLEQLEQELAAAQAKAEQAAIRAAERRAKEEREREARWKQHDQARLAAYDDTALAADVQAAEQQLRDAILADPIHRAAIAVTVARTTRYNRYSEAMADAARLGVPDFRPTAPPVADFDLRDFVGHVLVDEAHRLAEAERSAVEQARIDAGEGR